MTSINKIKPKNSSPNKEKNLARSKNKSFKNFPHSLKQLRSSTNNLKQHSKLLLLQNPDLIKSSVFLKKQSINTTNLLKIPFVQNKLLEKYQPKDEEKLNKILDNLKKKKSDNVTPQTSSNLTPHLRQQSKISRITTSSQQGSRGSHTRSSSLGKLFLGKNFLPQKIQTKQERWDPFYEEQRLISEEMISKKGVYNLINAGMLPSEYDFLELLNNKYEVLPEPPKQDFKKQQTIIAIQDDNETFMTNPALINQYEAHRRASEASLNDEQNQKKQVQEAEKKRSNKIRKTKFKKTKKIINDPLEKIAEILTVEVSILSVFNFNVEKDQNYRRYLKQSLKEGNDKDFFELVKKIQEFSEKYGIKKFKFKPNLCSGQKMTQWKLIQMIQDFKLLGYDKTIRKSKNVLEQVVKRAFEMHHMRKTKAYLKTIDNFKKYFRLRKYYYDYVEKRFSFYQYRLESFAEEQRKFIEDFVERKMLISDYNPKIEIHILTKQSTFEDEQSYYKLRQRLRIQMMRIFNSQPADIIFLTDPVMIGDVKQEMKFFIKRAMKLAQKLSELTNKLPRIHILHTGMKTEDVSFTGRTYYGITSEIIKLVKDICKGQKPVLIPYESSNLLPFFCEVLNANLFGGTYNKECLQIIASEGNQQKSHEAFNGKFKEMKRMPTFQIKISKLKNLKLSNGLYEDKSKIYDLFSTKLGKKMPFRISTKNKTQLEFYQEFVSKVSSRKESTKWILKISNGKFSRGIASLETNDLKVFQQSRKRPQISEIQIKEISQLMSIILRDKIVLGQPHLMEKQKFLNDFFTNENSYIEEFVQNSQKICIFGKILPNGTFIFQGTYKKYYTKGVGFGASYPAEQVDQSMIEELKQISLKLSEESVFGYVTFQLLYQQKSKTFSYLDFTPNLDEYSSLFFLYDTLFKSSQIHEENQTFNILPRKLFFCPFLDNNGNKFKEIEEFLDECRDRKVWYNSITQEGQMFLFLKDDPSMLGLIALSNSEYQSIKYCIEAVSLLVELGGKFNQFDKTYMSSQDLKTDGLYVMDILWKLRQIRKKLQTSQMTQSDRDSNRKG